MEFVALLAVAVIAFGLGVAFQRRRSVDYRQRWREALALLDGRDELGGPKKAAPSPAGKGDGLTMKQLHRLPSWSRVELEEQRRDAGLPLRDDLEGLPSWSVVEIMGLRT